MRYQYILGFILASTLVSVEGLPVKYQNLFKRTETLTIQGTDGLEHKVETKERQSSGITQAIADVEGRPDLLVKKRVSRLEAMITEAYEPKTIIGTEAKEDLWGPKTKVKETTTGAHGETSAAGAASGASTQSPKEKFKSDLNAVAAAVHKLGPEATLPALLKATLPITRPKNWYMIMPKVGIPIRDLQEFEDALKAPPGPDKTHLEKICKAYVGSHVLPAIHAALKEWYTVVYKALGQHIRFRDFKTSHFRFIHGEGGTLQARMIDFGISDINPINETPNEDINAKLWEDACLGLNLSNTPSEKAASSKAASDKAPSQKSGTAGQGPAGDIPAASAPHQPGHPVLPVTNAPATHPGMSQPPPSQPMAIPHAHSTTAAAGGGGGGGSDGGSTGSSSGCKCSGLCRC
ncbi:hypothetical protein FRC14_006693 [Serendipita sp. 396]|nr:hypothetical protein FRC14_006693 [Serendipita sp. 396]KAG8778994.1 hypothetical protein FRC15_010434 [Serendipita sp. 397]KAG8796143.1 hypothetical protein FRC16_009802 [Serendipita sp. 398]KAG8864380.1 hypothetical protein FRC20_010274 [Serendipita sp. 405]